MKPAIKEGYTRITSVIAPFTGYDKIPAKILQNAADRGTRVHMASFEYMIGMEPFMIEEERPYFDSFLKWYDPRMRKPIIEQRFYSDEYELTGEIDLLVPNTDDLVTSYTMYDLKTSAKPNKTWCLQAAGYKMICPLNITKAIFIHLKKDGSAPDLIEYNPNEFVELFKSTYEVYKFFYQGKKNEPLSSNIIESI